MTVTSTRRFDSSLASLPGAWTGKVEMAFSSSAVARRQADGSLLTLLDRSRPLVPWGIALPAATGLPGQGEAILLEGRVLGWGGHEARLSGPGASLCLPASTSSPSRSTLGRQLASLPMPSRTKSLLEANGHGNGIEQRVFHRAGMALGRVCQRLVKEEPSADGLGSAIADLAGLGPGLTPTGDDLLVGVAGAAHRLAGAGCLGHGRLAALVGALEALPVATTTSVSRQMLAHAAAGAFPEPLAPLLTALGDASAPPEALSGLAQDLSAVGSWSGCDMLAGVLALSRQWLETEGGGWQ